MAKETRELTKEALLEAEVAELKKALAKAQTEGGQVSMPVNGTFSVEWEDPIEKGKKITKKVKFKNGRTKVRLLSGVAVSSEAVLRIANGGEATTTELKANPDDLANLSKEAAIDLMTTYVKMNAGFLEEVK